MALIFLVHECASYQYTQCLAPSDTYASWYQFIQLGTWALVACPELSVRSPTASGINSMTLISQTSNNFAI